MSPSKEIARATHATRFIGIFFEVLDPISIVKITANRARLTASPVDCWRSNPPASVSNW
jgi:hypothetical protein